MTAPSPEDRAAAERLADLILDHNPANEPYHAQDCPACHIADEIIAALAVELDPLDNWYPDHDDPPEAEDTCEARALVRHVAFVLHRRLPGHGRNAA